MPIRPSVLQRRHAEQGRIRLGTKGDRGQPVKLTTFRFTSPNERHIRALADRYGGQAREWQSPAGPEWEVITDARDIAVTVLKGATSQSLEAWSGGGCVHRCDGEVILDRPRALAGHPCSDDHGTITFRERGKPDRVELAHDAAKPTTRVGVMLPGLESIGAWRLETHGWNAAAEIPAIAELAAYVGDLVPARMHLVERRSVSEGQTRRFVVPVIDLELSAERLREVVAAAAGMAPELEGPGSRRELGSSASRTPGVDPFEPWFAEVSEARSREELSTIWRRMVAEQLVGEHAAPSARADEFVRAWRQRAREVPAEAEVPSQEPDEDGVVDAVVVEDEPPVDPDAPPSDGDADAAWDRVVKVGGDLGMSLADLDEGFAAWTGTGETAADATAAQLDAYAAFLRRDAS